MSTSKGRPAGGAPAGALRLHEVLAGSDVLLAPGVHDPLGARVVEDLGFEAIYLGGWATGAHLATPEPLLTMSEQLATAERIARATNLPLIVDAGAGFGEPLHTIRTVREFAASGIAAIHIEDQQYPKRAHYHKGVEHVEERTAFLAKLESALSARADSPLLIFARTDAAKAVNGDWKEAAWRCNAALDAGVDAVMPLTRDEETLLRVRRELPDDAVVVSLAGYLDEVSDKSPAEYAELGFAIVLFALPAIVVAAGALRALYAPLKADGRLPATGCIGIEADRFGETRAMVETLIGLPAGYEVEQRTVEGIR